MRHLVVLVGEGGGPLVGENVPHRLDILAVGNGGPSTKKSTQWRCLIVLTGRGVSSAVGLHDTRAVSQVCPHLRGQERCCDHVNSLFGAQDRATGTPLQ